MGTPLEITLHVITLLLHLNVLVLLGYATRLSWQSMQHTRKPFPSLLYKYPLMLFIASCCAFGCQLVNTVYSGIRFFAPSNSLLLIVLINVTWITLYITLTLLTMATFARYRDIFHLSSLSIRSKLVTSLTLFTFLLGCVGILSSSVAHATTTQTDTLHILVFSLYFVWIGVAGIYIMRQMVARILYHKHSKNVTCTKPSSQQRSTTSSSRERLRSPGTSREQLASHSLHTESKTQGKASSVVVSSVTLQLPTQQQPPLPKPTQRFHRTVLPTIHSLPADAISLHLSSESTPSSQEEKGRDPELVLASEPTQKPDVPSQPTTDLSELRLLDRPIIQHSSEDISKNATSVALQAFQRKYLLYKLVGSMYVVDTVIIGLFIGHIVIQNTRFMPWLALDVILQSLCIDVCQLHFFVLTYFVLAKRVLDAPYHRPPPARSPRPKKTPTSALSASRTTQLQSSAAQLSTNNELAKDYSSFQQDPHRQYKLKGIEMQPLGKYVKKSDDDITR